MDVRLFVTNGRSKAQVIRLRTEETIIGRQRGCDVRIPAADVSRRHCRLSFRDGAVVLEDLASANGSWLNGVAVIGQEIVRSGDQLQIGPVIFRVEYEASLTAEPLAVAAAGASAESIPVAEEELETERHPQPGEPVPEADEVMAVGEESVIDLDDLAWRAPENADIRDILSKMEDK